MWLARLRLKANFGSVRIHLLDYVDAVSPHLTRNLTCMEMFAGWGGIASAFADHNLRASTYDIEREPAMMDFNSTLLGTNWDSWPSIPNLGGNLIMSS